MEAATATTFCSYKLQLANRLNTSQPMLVMAEVGMALYDQMQGYIQNQGFGCACKWH